MTIVESIKAYIKTYASLKTGAPVWVDYLGANPTSYSIVTLPGDKIIEEYISGGSLREFPFALQSAESTADELERLENIGFYEAFSDWLESQTFAGTLPTLDGNKTAVEISANGWGYLFAEGQSDTGIYQITAKLIYEQN